MRRFTFTIIVCLTIVVCQAQEHLQFMEIPICGTVEQLANRLVNEKGFTLAEQCEYEDPDFKMETKMLTGNFETFKDCVLLVRKIEGATEASSIIVYVDSLNCLNGELERLNELYDEKYGEHSSYWGNNKWESDGGRILIGGLKGGCYIAFMDKPEVIIRDALVDKKMEKATKFFTEFKTWKERQTVKEICGVPFGSSYEEAKEILENKYGSPEYNPDRTVITYKCKSYAGFVFDSILFLFQSDGIHSYLNGCIFAMDAKSLSDAKRKQEMLYKKLSDKYVMYDGTDNNGNKFYYGGFSPISDEKTGFSIEILKFPSDIARYYSPYATRLAYGRYNYVKEEF